MYSYSAKKINPAQLSRKSRTHVSSISMSVSVLSNKIVKITSLQITTSDRFPIPVRLAVKSNLTAWYATKTYL